MSEEKKYTLEELQKDLNEKNIKFCHRWIIDYNNVQSYLYAYPESSYDAACVSAYDLLRKPKIKQYIDFIKDDIAKEAGISKLSLINELKILAFSNLPQIIEKYEEGGLNALSEDQQKAISEYIHTKKELGEGGTIIDSTIKFKLHDKRGSIQDILRAMGWNEADKIHHSGEINDNKQINLTIGGKEIDLGYKDDENKSTS